MPTLFKRSNGIYYAILTDKLGRRRWVSTKERTSRSAMKRLVELQSDPQETIPRILLQSFYHDLAAWAKQMLSKETISIYDRSFTKFIDHVGNIPLTSISARHIDLFKAKRLSEVKAVTVNIELRTLRAGLNTALRWKLIEENPFRSVRLCQVDDTMPAYFSLPDFQKLIAAIDAEWFRQIVIVAVLTGMRRGELLNLQWSDVDLEKRLIRIQSRGDFRTKSGRKRVVPMNPYVFQIVTALASAAKSDYVFTCRGENIPDRGLSLRFKRLVRKLKLSPGLHFHSLRHSFASWLVQEGVSIYDVQKLLGHSNIRVTEIYSHLAPEELHKSVNRIPFQLN